MNKKNKQTTKPSISNTNGYQNRWCCDLHKQKIGVVRNIDGHMAVVQWPNTIRTRAVYVNQLSKFIQQEQPNNNTEISVVQAVESLDETTTTEEDTQPRLGSCIYFCFVLDCLKWKKEAYYWFCLQYNKVSQQ